MPWADRCPKRALRPLPTKTVYATVTFDGPTGRQVVDARPSDALNLALRTWAPTRVAAAAINNLQEVEPWSGATPTEWL
jgi:bifunctional DNase/RNase